MKNIIKLFLIFALVFTALGSGASIVAQENTEIADEAISAEDLEVSDPTLLPDSPFYFLKEWTRSVRSAFTFNNVKKAELENKFSNEKLVELKKMVENKIDPEKIKKAAEKYQKAAGRVKNATDKIKDEAEDNPEVNKFLEKFTNQQVLHEKILQKLEGQAPEQVLEKIKEAREQHLEKFKDIMIKLETNQEKIAEKIQNALQNGDISNTDILEKIKEKMPEEVKQKIEEKRANIVNKIIEKSIQKSETKKCPLLTKPSPDFCKLGKIKVEKNNEGCTTSFKCIMTNAEPIANCKELWWFDKDNRTCQQKKFCGAFMYLGLRTFEIKDQCEKQLLLAMAKEVSWDEALKILKEGKVDSADQSHAKIVRLRLKNGSWVKTIEPYIDDIMKEIEKCGEVCKNISVATE